MKHISEIMDRIKQHASKAKFYQTNREIFQRHFQSHEHYTALITAGNFDKMEGIIQENTEFSFDEWESSRASKEVTKC